jgi:hypothetical protein
VPPPDDFPEHVRRLLAEHVDSIEMLESMLLLRRLRPAALTADELSTRLYTSPRSAAMRLDDLQSAGLATRAGEGAAATYTYASDSGDLDRAIADLEQIYAQRRTSVINFIYARPSSRIRTFADAFRIGDAKK